MTCQTCGELTERGPLCPDCLDERTAHRAAKARLRAAMTRRRHPTPTGETHP